LTPKATSRAWSACGFNRPWKLEIIASAGFPGIRRGKKKLIVKAAQRVMRKNSRRRMMKATRVNPLREHGGGQRKINPSVACS
jgi:hypothetical protein